MIKDEVIAQQTNLTSSNHNYDLYAYVADHVWEEIADQFEGLEDTDSLEMHINEIVELKKQLQFTEKGTPERSRLLIALKEAKADKEVMTRCAIVFWNRITDIKQRRKIVKRNTMTISYGSTAYGMGRQQIDDAQKHGIELLRYMEHMWASYLGRLVFSVCTRIIDKPMQLLGLFSAAGSRIEDEHDFLRWNTPITNFPVIQHYTRGYAKKIYVNYGPDEECISANGYSDSALQVTVRFKEEPERVPGKQKSGAAPNIVHSLDATHLVTVKCSAPFTITTVHDSFGCLPNKADDMFAIVRERFVDLYSEGTLYSICKQIDVVMDIPYGEFNIDEVLDSPYSFI